MEHTQEVVVPDIGDFREVPIVEVLVAVGDRLSPETPVVILESDKASMEVPAGVSGEVVQLLVGEGDRVSEGSRLLRYRPGSLTGNDLQGSVAKVHVQDEASAATVNMPSRPPVATEAAAGPGPSCHFGPAAPSVRRLARELGVVLSEVVGSGDKGRVRKEDVLAHVKRVMTGGGARPQQEAAPAVDFAQFGPIEVQPLGRIQKISGAQLARNWATIPHVTSFEEADISALDQFRRQLAGEQQVRLTLLPFLLKAVQHCLQRYPQLNSSLQGAQLVVKGYYHLGFAVDTPAGLLVPVIREVDRKGIIELAEEVAELSGLAQHGRLKPEQMQGGTFTLSSIGGIGTTHFTPIINAPEVAILGIGRAAMRPVWDGSQFTPRLILPLSLSWDHRAMDGVTAARFANTLCAVLADFRRVVL